jgi:hypothetical protein
MTDLVKLSAAVLSTLMLDGKTHQPGAVVELDETTFDALVALKVVEPSDQKPSPAKAQVMSGDELAALVREAIGKLEASDFEADGAPKLAAVQGKLPDVTKGLTKKLVAEVWAGLKTGTANG